VVVKSFNSKELFRFVGCVVEKFLVEMVGMQVAMIWGLVWCRVSHFNISPIMAAPASTASDAFSVVTASLATTDTPLSVHQVSQAFRQDDRAYG
jgi:hypothetical protein